MNKAKLFISHHPSNLFLFKNLVRIIRENDKDSKIILFKINHDYFLKFNFEPYKKYFDEIVEFDFINYEKNFIKSYWQIFNFIKKIKKVKADLLNNFQSIDLFLSNSAWLPINVLLYNLSKEKNINKINRFNTSDHFSSQSKTDRFRTFLCYIYSLLFSCYKVKAISSLTGKFLDFAYIDKTPGDIIDLVSPTSEILLNNSNSKQKHILSFPVIFENSSKAKKDMVVVFGDNTIFQFYSEYISDQPIFIKKLMNLFKDLENKYYDCQLYYKSHPSDGGRFLPGIDEKKYKLFDNSVNAEMIFHKYSQRIKAVYTVSSVSAMMGSFFAIPSYTFYHYLFNQNGIKKLDNLFNKKSLKSKFLFHISNLNDIGKIDNLERPKSNINKYNVLLIT